MKRLLIGILLMFPAFMPLKAQSDQVDTETCSPIKNGKIVYEEKMKVSDARKGSIYKVVSEWAKKNYAKDVFFSNVVYNKKKFSLKVTSQVELLLEKNKETKPKLYYQLDIACFDNRYEITASHLEYEYEPKERKRHKKINAERIILEEGRANEIDYIKDAETLCAATKFYITNTFADLQQFMEDNIE